MSSCQCCLKPHPSRLFERYNSSIQTIKFLHKNCSIFENLLFDEYEYLERISSNLNKYLMQYGQISHSIFSYVSQLFRQINYRLENLRKFLYEFECLTTKCSIWLKKNSIKQIYSQLKYSKKQFESLENFVQRHSHLIQYQNNVTKKFWKDFSDFQSNYQQQCIQMDTIEYEHMKLFLDSIQLFSSRNHEKIIPNINIQQIINEWKENNKFRITWLPNEHQLIENNEKIIEQSSSDIDIKATEDCANDNQDKYVHESNLSWSFTIAQTKEDLSIPSSMHSSTDQSQPISNIIRKSPAINRVRLAIEAIERNNQDFPRGRKS